MMKFTAYPSYVRVSVLVKEECHTVPENTRTTLYSRFAVHR